MNKVKIGILGPADIAYRKFLPAIKSSNDFDYEGIAVASLDERNQLTDVQETSNVYPKSIEKANKLMNEFGGIVFNSYEELLTSNIIQAVYIPLPPAMHYFWAKKALENGKHVLLEKPFTTELSNTIELINIAKKKQLALHENYAFCYHEQIKQIINLINEGEIGEIRQVRSAFGFPYRGANDFRYNKSLGGGALLDCGGYPIKLVSMILGVTGKVTTASLGRVKDHEVDIYGSATLENDQQISAQVSFGMDNSYKCEVEIWGSKGSIYAPRIFTAPSDLNAELVLRKEKDSIVTVPMEDQFWGSINHFYCCIVDNQVRNKTYDEIMLQSKHIDDVIRFNSSIKGVKS